MPDQTLRHIERRLPRYTSYPTAPHFSAAIGAAEYRDWLGAVAPKTAVSLYLHIPFCNELCWFCGCNTRVVRNAEIIAQYADRLMDEIDLVADALPDNLPVDQVHFGGGSPNALGPVTTVPPPKSSITAFAASMNHKPIYPPLAAYGQPLASREPIKVPFR